MRGFNSLSAVGDCAKSIVIATVHTCVHCKTDPCTLNLHKECTLNLGAPEYPIGVFLVNQFPLGPRVSHCGAILKCYKNSRRHSQLFVVTSDKLITKVTLAGIPGQGEFFTMWCIFYW
jgi:hypothetical protein